MKNSGCHPNPNLKMHAVMHAGVQWNHICTRKDRNRTHVTREPMRPTSRKARSADMEEVESLG